MKEGLDYFPLNVTDEDVIELVEAEFGTEGFAVIIKLMQKIYGGYGYYCNWSRDIEMIFAKRVGIPLETVSAIIDSLMDRGFFNRDMYEKNYVLTSEGIQKQFYEITNRRKEVFFKKKYLLFNPKRKNVYIIEENVDIFDENAYISEQSKVKESKAKESKVCECDTPAPEKKPYGDYKNVFLSDEERKSLVDRYGKDASEIIEKLSEYMESTGRSYRSHYATINRWAKQDIRGAPEKGEFDDLEMLTRLRVRET